MSQTAEPLTFKVPLSFEAHAIAQRYQSQHSLTLKARQVYLNALAVYAVDFYLRCLGFETDPDQSDCRNPLMVKFIDVADLSVKQLGKLECRLVMSKAEVLQIPPDVWTDRIGYVAVQINETLKYATLLGFTQTPVAELPLAQLRSLSDLLERLQQLQPTPSAIAPAVSSGKAMSVGKAAVNLRNWLQGEFNLGWQTLEEILGIDKMPLVAVRSLTQLKRGIKRAKLIDVGMQLGEKSVVLSIAITSKDDISLNALIQVYPGPDLARLPSNLKLVMLSEAGEILQQVCSREQDNYIQLRRFVGQAGDFFNIQVILDNVCVLESFFL